MSKSYKSLSFPPFLKWLWAPWTCASASPVPVCREVNTLHHSGVLHIRSNFSPSSSCLCFSARSLSRQFYSTFALHGNNLAYINCACVPCDCLWFGLPCITFWPLNSHISWITVVVCVDFLSFLSLLGLSITCLNKEVAPRKGSCLLA